MLGFASARRLGAVVIAGAVATVTGLVSAGPALAATATVNETNLGVDWFQEDQRGAGAIAFTTQFGAPVGLGTGALQLSTTDSVGDKANLYTHAMAGTPLSQVTDLSYWTYRSHTSGEPLGIAAASYQLQVDLNGLSADGGFTTLVYEPYNDQGNSAVQTDTWQHWDVDASSKLWSSRSYSDQNGSVTAGAGGAPFYSVGQLAATFPAAVVVGLGVNVGSFNPGYVVATDGLTFNGTQYNFEPSGLSKESCKNGGWAANYSIFVNQGDCVSYFASAGATHREQ